MNSPALSLSLLLLSLLLACSDVSEKDANHPTKVNELSTLSERESTIWDTLNTDLKSTPVKVNRYIWQASLEVLDFMPIEKIDPFTGVIVMGYGRPPGGKTKYQATVYVSDPALDARTLRVALRTPAGPAAPETMRALEDAILSRARQIREADNQFQEIKGFSHQLQNFQIKKAKQPMQSPYDDILFEIIDNISDLAD